VAQDKARSAYLTVISVDPAAVSSLPVEKLRLAAAYAKQTGRPCYDLSKYTGTPKGIGGNLGPSRRK